MKNIIKTLAALFVASSVFAQSPEKMSYQAVVRDANNELVSSSSVGTQVSILQGSANGSAVYVETQTPSSNANGLVSIEIGAGTVVSGNFNSIDWANGPYFIKTETDPTGGTNYTITGTSQILSVPYALHAKTAESVTGGITETDPTFGASVASGITAADTTYWNNKLDSYTETDPIFGASVASGITTADTTYWNNKLDSYTETDPIFGASVASGITTADTTYWNNKLDSYTETDPIFGASVASGITTADTTYWNNKLDSYTETDPIFGASPSAGIVAGDLNNWNAAYNWGNHANVGYLTTELDGDTTNELQTLSLAGSDLSISDGNTVTLPVDDDWTVNGNNMYSAVTGNVGIGTTTPDNLLDVNGKISLTQSVGDEMVIINDDVWQHGSGDQDFGTGGAHFIMASRETDYESAGIYGDGNVLTFWAPGDANNGQPSALIYVCDEDRFDGAVDNNPHNNNSVYAYLNTAGNWVAASDKNRKEDIKPLNNSLDKILAVNGYSYKFKLVEEEIKKGDITPESIGVLAQEVKNVIPEVVEIAEDGSHYVSYTEFIPILIEATKEQQEIIVEQKSENELLKLKLLELEKRLMALEKK